MKAGCQNLFRKNSGTSFKNGKEQWKKLTDTIQ